MARNLHTFYKGEKRLQDTAHAARSPGVRVYIYTLAPSSRCASHIHRLKRAVRPTCFMSNSSGGARCPVKYASCYHYRSTWCIVHARQRQAQTIMPITRLGDTLSARGLPRRADSGLKRDSRKIAWSHVCDCLNSGLSHGARVILYLDSLWKIPRLRRNVTFQLAFIIICVALYASYRVWTTSYTIYIFCVSSSHSFTSLNFSLEEDKGAQRNKRRNICAHISKNETSIPGYNNV